MMDNLKPKNEQRIGRMTFFVAWVVIAVIGSFISQLIIQFFPSDMFTDLTQVTLVITGVIFVTQLVVGVLQSIAIYRFWGIKIRHWWWITGIGSVVGHLLDKMITPIMVQFLPMREGSVTLIMLILLSAILSYSILSILQAYILKIFLDRVTIYALVLIVVGFIISYFARYVTLPPYFYAVFQGTCTGLALLWLDHITYENANDETHFAEVEA